MHLKRKFGFGNIAERVIRIGLLFVLALTGIIIGFALFFENSSQEAYIGSFRADGFNYKWRFEDSAETDYFSLPIAVDKSRGDEVVIVNTLPRYLSNGMTLLVRSTMEDVFVYVDGNLRAQYSSDSYEHMSYYIPSAYVAVNLYSADAGKEIKILYKFKTRRIITTMTIGYGNNSWFGVIKNGLGINLIAIIVFVLGVVLFIGSLFWQNSYRVGAAKNLGLLMINVSLWVISESTLRQFIFKRPSFSQYYSYLLVGLIGALACLYFDEVQHREYHRRYMIMEGIVLLQIIINILLEIGGIVEFYETLAISQIWNALCGVVSFINISTDIYTKRVKNYHITAIGIICFIIMGMGELVGFYFDKFHVFGAYISCALLVLMTATIIQTIYDEIKAITQREKSRTEMTINAIETIAGAIDARDEYTGGHSERVGLYAARLAREIAAEYDLTEEDILRIHYIGLVHDIGKIGVADNVLNKPGKLSDEEFSLMKKHTQIGYEIMSSLGETTEGLLDGIRYHHERFDGKGYPDGIAGSEIPLVSRILAIADSYDAMTSNRVYRNRLSDEKVRDEFVKCAGKQYDPNLAKVFVRLIDNGEINIEEMVFEATYKTEMVKNSILLESKLQNDLLTESVEVLNPSHVRMLCYIIKLMEKKGKGFRLLFADNKDDTESLGNAVKKRINSHDVFIQYTKTQYVVALYNYEQTQLDDFQKKLQSECPNVEIQRLT